MEDQEAMEEQRMEVIRELADLERERDKEVNKLKRKVRQTISRINFSQLEGEYVRVKEIHDRFASKIDDWTELLEANEDGEPAYPQRGMPESRYNPDNEDLARKTSQLEEALVSAKDALARFVNSLPAREQILIVQEAILPFLKNLDTIKAYCAENPAGIPEDQEEEDDRDTIVNGGENGANGEVPEGEENNVLNPGGDNQIPTPPGSPRNSIESSRSVRIRGKRYQIQKERINKLLSQLELDSDNNHSEHLKEQTIILSDMFKNLDTVGIISLADAEPDFLEIFGETEDQVNEWSTAAEFRIQDLRMRASKEISERKAATQTGFKKLGYPSFNGDVLNYQEFCKRWENEVVPERKPAALELAALRESVPALARAKIIASTTMAEAWKLLDLDYGNIQEVRAKLKQQVRSLKLKAVSGPAKTVELFHQVQLLSAKIKATGSITLLEDEEYIALVGGHLPKETMLKWWDSEKAGWMDFYAFLEKSANTAKK